MATKKKLKVPVIIISILIFFAVAFLGVKIFINSISSPMTITDTVTVTIEPGSSTATIASNLVQANLIKNESYFRYYVKKTGIDSQLKAGAYIFEAGEWSIQDVGELLVAGGNGDNGDVKVTIPEGLVVSDIADIFVEAGLADYDAFMEYANNGEFPYDYIPAPGQVIEPGNRLDGFLFPNTYMIDPDWTEAQIIDMLLAQFAEVWDENGFQARADEMNMSVYDIVIMASLVEKEALWDEDRPLIAGVFYNRLEAGMLLQSCVTIQFLLGEQKDVLLYSDLEIDSPYNTYKNPGLPPAPIACPGLASLNAALYPEESEYLYFRAQIDGTHRFSKTLLEHETKQPNDQ